MFVTDSFWFHKTLRLAAGGGAFAINGVPVTLLQINALSANKATFAVAGKSAALRKGSRIAAQGASYTLAGTTQLKRSLKLAATATSLAVSGQDVTLQKARLAGFVKTEAYIEGQDVALLRGLRLLAETAELEATAWNVGMLKVAGSISADPLELGAIAIEAQMLMARRLEALQQSLDVVGLAAVLRRGYPIAAQKQTYAISPKSTLLKAHKKVAAVKATYAISGKAAAIRNTRISYLASVSNSSDLPSYTFSSVDIGTATDGDILIIGVSAGNGNQDLTGLTVGGVAATEIVKFDDGSRTTASALYLMTGVSGPTANIVVTFSGSRGRCGVSTWRLTGFSTTPFATATASIAASTSGAYSTTIANAAGGCQLSIGYESDGSPVGRIFTSGPKTVRFNGNMDTNDYMVATDYIGPAAASRTWSMPSGGTTRSESSFVVAAFSPL